MLVPMFNSKLKTLGNGRKEYAGNHWALAVFHKDTATLRLYDSIHSSDGYTHIIPHLLQFANSVGSTYAIPQTEWPQRWILSTDVYSVQQGNGFDCGIFLMVNAFYLSRGILEPKLIPGEYVSNVYRPQLGLCLLENDISFLNE